MRSTLNPGRRAGCLLLLLCAMLMAQPRPGEAALLEPNGSPANPAMGEHNWVPDQIIVKFRPGALSLPPGRPEARVSEVAVHPDLHPIIVSAGVEHIRRAFPGCLPEDTQKLLESGQWVEVIDLSQVFVLRVQDGMSIPDLVELFEGNPHVVYAEPDHMYRYAGTPSDELFPQQWNLEQASDVDIDATTAWDYETGSYSIRLGIFDSGLDYGHPDLGAAFGPGWKVSGGWDYFGGGDSDPLDVLCHGTHVAGIAAALTHNSYRKKPSEPDGMDRNGLIGVAGVAGGWGYTRYWNSGNKGAQLIAMKVGDEYGISSSDAAEAIVDGADPGGYGTHVQNHSWGGYSYNVTLASAVLYAAQMNRVFVAAKGPSGTASLHYPSDYAPNWVISVGATDQWGNRWPNSDIGNGIDLVAPGVDVLSTTPTYMTWPMSQLGIAQNYDCMTGTSMATPHAAGLAALLLSTNPSLAAEDVEGIIRAAAVDHEPIGYDDEYGAGLINAGTALTMAHLPWTLSHFATSGGTSVGYTSAGMTFCGDGPIPDGSIYATRRHDVRKTVPVSGFSGQFHAWGRGMNTTTLGWSASNPNWQAPFCEVASVTSNSVELRTFVYQKVNWLGQPLNEWYPCQPSQVVFEYSLLGIPLSARQQGETEEASAGASRSGIPLRLTLEEIRPNPFSGGTTITFGIPSGCHATVEAHDMSGHLVATLVDRSLPAGYHTVRWQAAGVSDGVYVCSIRTETGSLSRLIAKAGSRQR